MVPEQPPDGLCIEFTYTRGGMMSKYDLWTTITRVIAKVASLGWNAELAGSITFPVVSNVEIKFVSSVNPPRYQTKTVIWTLVEVFDYYSEERHYSNCFIKTQLGRGPTARNLGVASIKSTLSTVPDLQTDLSVLSLPNETSSASKFSGQVLEPSTQMISNQSVVSDSDLSIPRSGSRDSTSFQARSRGLVLVLNYVSEGATFSDKGFFRLILSTLVFAAQNDPKTAPSGLLRTYDSEDNYTLSIGPTSDAARDNLPWKLVIPTLGFLPSQMLDARQGGRWAELVGKIKLDGAYIGRIQILKGDHRNPHPHSCGMSALDTGGDRVDIAASIAQA